MRQRNEFVIRDVQIGLSLIDRSTIAQGQTYI